MPGMEQSLDGALTESPGKSEGQHLLWEGPRFGIWLLWVGNQLSLAPPSHVTFKPFKAAILSSIG